MPIRYWILTITVLLLCIGLYMFGRYTSEPKLDYEEQLRKIEMKLDSLYAKKDSVRTVIITVDREIIKNTKDHEKIVNSIIIQPAALDSVFARDYIKRFIDERVR